MDTNQKKMFPQHPDVLEALRRTSREAGQNRLLLLFEQLEKSMFAAAKIGKFRLFIANEPTDNEYFAPFVEKHAQIWLKETYGLDVVAAGKDWYVSWEEK